MLLATAFLLLLGRHALATTLHGLSVSVSTPPRVCDVFSYGAVGDGRADDTAALQAALTACSSGGTTLLPSNGTYLSFGLALPSSTSDFALQVDGRLLFNNDTKAPAWHGVTACLLLRGAGVALIGAGVVDGQGAAWWPCAKAGCARPGLVLAQDVSNLLIANLTFRDSPNHQLELYASPFEVAYVTILAPPSTGGNGPFSHNTDGIDVHGNEAHIHHCHISTGDDHIAFHANSTVVEFCTFGTGHGTSIGSLGDGTYLQNITVRDSSYEAPTTALHVKVDTHSSGFLRDVLFQRLSMSQAGTTILIESNYPSHGGNGVGTLQVSNISFIDIVSDGALTAGQFVCSKAAPCEGIRLINVAHTTPGPETQWTCSMAHGMAQNVTPAISCLLP